MNKVLYGIIITIALLLCCTACGIQEVHNGIPDYYLEPEGYVIAEIKTEKYLNSGYGYIKEEDYISFQNGQLTGNLVILNPYEQGKSYTIAANSILGIVVGTYKNRN